MKSMLPALLTMMFAFGGCHTPADTAELAISAGQPQKISDETAELPTLPSQTVKTEEIVLSDESVPLAEMPTLTYAEKTLVQLNQKRAAAGLAPFTLDATLTAAAQTRSAEVKSSFSHTRPNGTACFTILEECGISSDNAAENIAGKITSSEKVVNAWMNSESHRRHILNPVYTTVGIGYTDGGYWSLLLIG